MTSHLKNPQERERKEKERNIEALVAFATRLSRRLDRHLSPPPSATSTSDPVNDFSSLTEIVPTLSNHLTKTFDFDRSSATILTKRAAELDDIGTKIWNAATRLGRERGNGANNDKKVLCKVRAFAVLVLDAVAAATTAAGCSGGREGKERDDVGGEIPPRKKVVEKGVRVLRVALKAARCCVEVGLVEEGGLMKVLQCAAKWEGVLKDADVQQMVDVDTAEAVRRLRAEYWMLRVVHALKQSRLDLAEHNFSKSDLEPNRLAADTADLLTDTLFEIGRDSFHKGKNEEAVKWLERAFDVIGERNVEELDHNAVELRLAILNFLVRACLKIHSPESMDKARSILDVLEFDHGEKLMVQLLKLEVISADPGMEIEQYYGVMTRMIQSIVLTDANFKTIMHHIHIIKGKSPELACKALDKLLYERLFTHEDAQWIEKVAVTQIWIIVSNEQPPGSLLDLLDAVLQHSRPFDPPATHAAQTILWKKIETLYSQGKYLESESWCSIALHPLFAKAGDSNKAKISRKLIMCAVARQEHNIARKVFFEMPAMERDNPMTRYLMYKSAIRDQQPEFAAECLDAISKRSEKDCTLLYACVVEAQELRDRENAILALQKALEKYDYGAPVGVNLPALLRSTIRLLDKHLGAPPDTNEEAMREICKVFEGATVQAAKDRTPRPNQQQSKPVFTEKELEWFSRNSYNLALKHCGSAQPAHLLCLLDKCIQFISLLQTASFQTDNSVSAPDLILRLLLCHYLASCAAIVLARSTDSVPESLSAYATVSRHAVAFRNTAAPLVRATPAALNNGGLSTGSAQSMNLGAATKADLAAKRAQLLRYELESALKRSDWDGLEALWDECFDDMPDPSVITNSLSRDAGNSSGAAKGKGKGSSSSSNWYVRHLETLADLALVIHAELLSNAKTDSTKTHRARILGVLQRIVNQSCSTTRSTAAGGSDAVVHLARWIRCLFQLSIDDGSNNVDDLDAIPLQCIEQATAVIIFSSTSGRGRNDDAQDEDRGGTSYPLIEAEWLASMAFNRAIDFFCASDDARCKVWAEKAIELARAAGAGRRSAGGGLYGVLVERYKGLLRWE